VKKSFYSFQESKTNLSSHMKGKGRKGTHDKEKPHLDSKNCVKARGSPAKTLISKGP
jgi:hypothetical protein